MMIKELKLTRRRRLLGAVVICVVLITGSTILWQMGQVAEAAILDPHHPGLVGWWRFDEEAGTVAQDSSGYGNHGTVYGDATWVDGKYGKALGFDGVDDYVKVPDSASLDVTDEITIEAWIKPSGFTDLTYEGIVHKENPDDPFQTTAYGLCVGWSTNQFLFFATTFNGKGLNLWSIARLQIGTWQHLVATYDSHTHTTKLYYNGQLDVESAYAITGTINTTTRPVHIGRRQSHYFNGIIDEVHIYNRALSGAEIQETFQKGPDFSSRFLAKVPKGTTQFIVTLSWQGRGSTNVTIESPSKVYTEDIVPVYHRTTYSPSGGISNMLNIKRLTVSVTALSSYENWYVTLDSDDVEDYRIAVEVQK